MEILKLTSIRLSKSALARANQLGRSIGYYKTSDVLRIAIWLGLKFLTPVVLQKFMLMMCQEEINGTEYSAGDILRTIGELLENHKSLE